MQHSKPAWDPDPHNKYGSEILDPSIETKAFGILVKNQFSFHAENVVVIAPGTESCCVVDQAWSCLSFSSTTSWR
jgi:hypothetical protein